MRILLDNCVDVRFKDFIVGHEVVHALELGWGSLSNGNLIAAAEGGSFDAMVTVDKGLRHQQNISGLSLTVITLTPTFVTLDDLVPLVDELLDLLTSLPQGRFVAIGPRDS